MTEILVLTAPEEATLPGLEQLPDTVTLKYVSEPESLRAGLRTADILVVTDFRSSILEECWPDSTTIRWVHATSAGIDTLRFAALWHSEIAISNAQGIFNRGIAEYVLGAVLMFSKDFLGNLHYQQQAQWRHRETRLLRQQQVLIVGAGSIGTDVGQLLSTMGMQVTGVARSARAATGFTSIHAQASLPELLPQADFVVITAPLTPTTEGLFDNAMFAAIKPGAYLINVGRGPIVCTDALMQALDSGQLAGAALDVLEEEPLPAEHPLWAKPNVMISAHMAGDFIGWREALGQQFVENFSRWQKGEVLLNPVTR
ncbi:D-2-hydroxyacid dehydrogenase [Pontibacter sp. JAM-7]|uniref:D-2-hydroxyacid dehydrogenase n=1 Tax=Pontibacter sp. JAM-7 TaxID=3366581 RepID=UPI003AF73E2D